VPASDTRIVRARTADLASIDSRNCVARGGDWSRRMGELDLGRWANLLTAGSPCTGVKLGMQAKGGRASRKALHGAICGRFEVLW